MYVKYDNVKPHAFCILTRIMRDCRIHEALLGSIMSCSKVYCGNMERTLTFIVERNVLLGNVHLYSHKSYERLQKYITIVFG